MPKPHPKVAKLEALLDRFGNLAVASFHYIALYLAGCLVVAAAGHTVVDILAVPRGATSDDMLLLFICVRPGATVAVYFKPTHGPVGVLIYMAVGAVHRVLIADIAHAHKAGR